jgi:DNA-binding transcriptional regulator YiaG
MTPERIREIRTGLGLSQNALAEVLRLGPNGGRTVRRWESGQVPISGPASVALELMKLMQWRKEDQSN